MIVQGLKERLPEWYKAQLATVLNSVITEEHKTQSSIVGVDV